MSSYIELKYDFLLCDIAKFGKKYLLLDDELKIHELDNTIKKGKSFSLLEAKSLKEKKLLLKNGSVLYIKDDKPNIFSLKDKSSKEFSWFGNNINAIAESFDGKMIAVGYNSGKVNIFLIDGEIYQSLYFDCGNITNLIFNQNDNRLIINGDKNKTIIHDVDLNITISTIVTKTNIIKALFLDEKRIFAISIDGNTQILDTKNGLTESSIDNNIKNPTSLFLNASKEYAIIGTKNGEVDIIFIQRNKILFSQKIGSSPILNIKWIDETLFFLFEDGNIVIIPLLKEHEEVKEKIKKRSYNEANNILSSNRFLSIFSDIEKELDLAWNEEIFPEALDFILSGHIPEAKDLVVPFIHDVYKKKVFNLYIDKSDIVDIFKTAYEDKDYANLYFVAEKFPHLKKSTMYKTVDSEWEIKYKKAFKVMRDGFKAQATQLLKDFNEVESKKNLISSLINLPRVFLEAEELYKSNNFDLYFSHIAKNSILKQTPEFLELKKEIDKLENEIKEAQKENNYRDMVILAKKLSTYKPYKTRAKEIIESVKSKITFLNYINKDDINSAYKIAQEDYEITHMKQFKELYKKYQYAEEQAYKFALDGDTEQVLITFKDFLNIGLFKDKISSIVKISYLKGIFKVKDTDLELINWKSTIDHYSLYFSVDEDLKEAAKKVGFEEYLYKVLGKIDKFGYRKYDFTEKIIGYKTEEELKKERSIQIPQIVWHYIIIFISIIVFVILAKVAIDIFSEEIYAYKQERKEGPYKLFERVFEYTNKGAE